MLAIVSALLPGDAEFGDRQGRSIPLQDVAGIAAFELARCASFAASTRWCCEAQLPYPATQILDGFWRHFSMHKRRAWARLQCDKVKRAVNAVWSKRWVFNRASSFADDYLNSRVAERSIPARSEPSAISRSKRRCGAVAILIAGQLKRFLWKDQSGDLVQRSAGCPEAVDVFVYLQNVSTVAPWMQQVADSTPYTARATVEKISRWYRKRGARNVTVEIGPIRGAGHDIVDSTERWLRSDRGLARGFVAGRSNITWEKHHRLRTNPFGRFRANLNMLRNRHLAFRLAQPHRHDYDMWTFWREDNYFFVPLDVAAARHDLDLGSPSAPRFVVDKYCGFGSLSDKVVITNTAGAVRMFGDSESTWRKLVAAYIIFGWHQKGYPYQTERFLTYLMRSSVKARDLHRTDLRYVRGGLCVPGLYGTCFNKLHAQIFGTCPAANASVGDKAETTGEPIHRDKFDHGKNVAL